jgi:plastocyanin
MGLGRRPLALAVLGLLSIALIGVIALQAVPPPTPPTKAPQAAAATAPAGSAAAPTTAPAASAASGSGASTTINATEKDFAIALDKSSVPTGTVTFHIKNDGPSPHNITIKELKKTSDTYDAGKGGDFKVDLPAGTYTVICDIPGHEQLGMHTTLTVK